jgi:peptidoglycan/LPS O-acetylase OafA/YrhL
MLACSPLGPQLGDGSGLRRIVSLDGIRGIAVLLVAAFHFGLLPFGWMGVQMFFVLSGYLITAILARERAYPLSFYLKRFYWRRALRIFPLYYAFMGVCAVLFFVVRRKSLLVFIPLLTYTYNWVKCTTHAYDDSVVDHLWSLAVEEQFYLVWPVIVYLLPMGVLRALVAAMLIVAPALRVLAAFMMPATEPGVFQYYATVAQLDAFAAGAAVAVFRFTRLRDARGAFWVWMAVLCAAGAVESMSAGAQPNTATLGFPIFMPAKFEFAWGYTLIDIGCALAILACVRGRPVARVLEHRVLTRLGQVSYGFYVFHLPILTAIRGYSRYRTGSPASFGIFAFFTLVTFMVSNASYRFFEQIFLRWKDARLTRPLVGRGRHTIEGAAQA